MKTHDARLARASCVFDPRPSTPRIFSAHNGEAHGTT